MKRRVGYVVWVMGTTWRLTAPVWPLALAAEAALSFYAIARGRVLCRLCRAPLWDGDVPLDAVNRMNEFWREHDASRKPR